MSGVNQKNFGLFLRLGSDMQAAQLLIKTVRSDNSLLRINLSKVGMAHAIRGNVT
jgi:hypothetical protein